jgi:hypothetical protein
MIRNIYADASAFSIIAYSLAEEGMEVEIGSSLLIGDELDCDKIVILRPDEWYNTARMGTPPKSVDGLVFVDNAGDFHMYVIELKSSRLPDLNRKHIQEKFNTIFQRFLDHDFAHLFNNASKPYNLMSLNLWLVCDPLRLRRKAANHDEFLRLAGASKEKMRTLMANYALGLKPISFRGLRAQIMPLLSPPSIEVDHYVDHLS